MIVGTLGVFYTLTLLKPVPVAPPEKLAAWKADPSSFPGFSPEIISAVNYNSGIFPWFLALFLFVFAATGVANGSTYRMIPHIFKAQAQNATAEGTVERYAAEAKAVKEGSAALGIIGAVGAMGGFLIPITFGSPWVEDPVQACKTAFLVFTAFYVVCLAVTWFVYSRRGATMAPAGV
jgi:NNP family nitrate/nitrite transporter-like MFS transporter